MEVTVRPTSLPLPPAALSWVIRRGAVEAGIRGAVVGQRQTAVSWLPEALLL
ncbi:MAG: hypothetical protein IPG75_14875 [Gemmatimonadetes bacterium]|nr:hypothetical protein [Gemmatimonadota bacterium]